MQVEQLLWTLVITITTGLIVSIATVCVTVYLALRSFRAERLWDRRVDAYQTVLEALHRVGRDCGVELARQSSPDFMAKHKPTEDETRKISEAYAEIHKVIDLGSFLVCNEAATCLEGLERTMNKLAKDVDYLSYLDSLDRALNECLKDLRLIAKNDLKKLRV